MLCQLIIYKGIKLCYPCDQCDYVKTTVKGNLRQHVDSQHVDSIHIIPHTHWHNF